jgi:hypothetical protein
MMKLNFSIFVHLIYASSHSFLFILFYVFVSIKEKVAYPKDLKNSVTEIKKFQGLQLES